uniref:Uncharacterized protein n=1 Tax=Rhizophora mucronata TaxID=61149 RepID=A0A2P2P3U6_RHIMU
MVCRSSLLNKLASSCFIILPDPFGQLQHISRILDLFVLQTVRTNLLSIM